MIPDGGERCDQLPDRANQVHQYRHNKIELFPEGASETSTTRAGRPRLEMLRRDVSLLRDVGEERLERLQP